jgi:hypothetical protein
MSRLLITLGTAAILSACAQQPSVPDETHLAQEQRACAEIGVAPGDAAYPRCIANLEAALFGLDKIPSGE